MSQYETVLKDFKSKNRILILEKVSDKETAVNT